MFKEPRTSKPKVFIDSRIEVRESPIHGWGIFAKEDIPKHTMIESAPVVICHKATQEALYEMNDCRHILQDYPFAWEAGYIAFAMGFAAIYNHKGDCSVTWRPNYDYKTMEFTTKRDVEAGEQITVRYLPVRLRGALWFADEEGGEIDAFEAVEDYNNYRSAGQRRMTSRNWKNL